MAPTVGVMTEQSPAVFPAHPPESILRVVNPILGFLLRTPVTGSALKAFLVLRFKGRKTGRQFALTLSAHRIDNDLYVLTGTAWRLNFRGGATAEVVHAGKTTAMRGELIEDVPVVADLTRRLAESYGVKGAQRVMGLKFRDPRIPTLEEFTEAVDANHLTAIRLTVAVE
ncbi:MAG: hypothetical protein QOI28_3763 [Mycobacterium sp.]|nr:hypothetical protein [Mycobacterium sp.]